MRTLGELDRFLSERGFSMSARRGEKGWTVRLATPERGDFAFGIAPRLADAIDSAILAIIRGPRLEPRA